MDKNKEQIVNLIGKDLEINWKKLNLTIENIVNTLNSKVEHNPDNEEGKGFSFTDIVKELKESELTRDELILMISVIEISTINAITQKPDLNNDINLGLSEVYYFTKKIIDDN